MQFSLPLLLITLSYFFYLSPPLISFHSPIPHLSPPSPHIPPLTLPISSIPLSLSPPILTPSSLNPLPPPLLTKSPFYARSPPPPPALSPPSALPTPPQRLVPSPLSLHLPPLLHFPLHLPDFPAPPPLLPPTTLFLFSYPPLPSLSTPPPLPTSIPLPAHILSSAALHQFPLLSAPKTPTSPTALDPQPLLPFYPHLSSTPLNPSHAHPPSAFPRPLPSTPPTLPPPLIPQASSIYSLQLFPPSPAPKPRPPPHPRNLFYILYISLPHSFLFSLSLLLHFLLSLLFLFPFISLVAFLSLSSVFFSPSLFLLFITFSPFILLDSLPSIFPFLSSAFPSLFSSSASPSSALSLSLFLFLRAFHSHSPPPSFLSFCSGPFITSLKGLFFSVLFFGMFITTALPDFIVHILPFCSPSCSLPFHSVLFLLLLFLNVSLSAAFPTSPPSSPTNLLPLIISPSPPPPSQSVSTFSSSYSLFFNFKLHLSYLPCSPPLLSPSSFFPHSQAQRLETEIYLFDSLTNFPLGKSTNECFSLPTRHLKAAAEEPRAC
ncbi:hypothetical protein C7M84_001793 [Penaeus vannamei]|uniref:Uncharacterized protein n=1 Tax=Penaeus vannamei TaxID=6689 RepID=A0A3R7MD90_PENVA|nr:hypothetical protein C7M84_001793 [Penaeus vannamei]